MMVGRRCPPFFRDFVLSTWAGGIFVLEEGGKSHSCRANGSHPGTTDPVAGVKDVSAAAAEAATSLFDLFPPFSTFASAAVQGWEGMLGEGTCGYELSHTLAHTPTYASDHSHSYTHAENGTLDDGGAAVIHIARLGCSFVARFSFCMLIFCVLRVC
jgi:hypothetical protein